MTCHILTAPGLDRAIHQLRIAIIAAWLHGFPALVFEDDDARDRCICMWLDTPPETVALWTDSELVDTAVERERFQSEWEQRHDRMETLKERIRERLIEHQYFYDMAARDNFADFEATCWSFTRECSDWPHGRGDTRLAS